MLMNNQFISEIISEKSNKFKIDIIDNNKQTIGYLSPITYSCLNNSLLLKKLTKWRNLAKKAFLTQFKATSERTKTWLENVVLNDNKRILFIIYEQETPVGHIGFINLNDKSA